MLNKENRLKKAADFQTVYSRGKFIVSKPLVLYYLYKGNEDPSRVGFVVSKKVGPSHVRSRTKRLMREALRKQFGTIPPGFDFILVARPPVAGLSFDDVYRTIAKLLRKSKVGVNS